MQRCPLFLLPQNCCHACFHIWVIDPKMPSDHLKNLESLCHSWSLLRWIGARRLDVQAFVQMTRLLVHSPSRKNIINITRTIKIAAKQRSVAHLESFCPRGGSEGMYKILVDFRNYLYQVISRLQSSTMMAREECLTSTYINSMENIGIDEIDLRQLWLQTEEGGLPGGMQRRSKCLLYSTSMRRWGCRPFRSLGWNLQVVAEASFHSSFHFAPLSCAALLIIPQTGLPVGFSLRKK